MRLQTVAACQKTFNETFNGFFNDRVVSGQRVSQVQSVWTT
jgi:hypothetical protein